MMSGRRLVLGCILPLLAAFAVGGWLSWHTQRMWIMNVMVSLTAWVIIEAAGLHSQNQPVVGGASHAYQEAPQGRYIEKVGIWHRHLPATPTAPWYVGFRSTRAVLVPFACGVLLGAWAASFIHTSQDNLVSLAVLAFILLTYAWRNWNECVAVGPGWILVRWYPWEGRILPRAEISGIAVQTGSFKPVFQGFRISANSSSRYLRSVYFNSSESGSVLAASLLANGLPVTPSAGEMLESATRGVVLC